MMGPNNILQQNQLFLTFGSYLDFPTEPSKDFSNFTLHPTPLIDF
jgi:hypothetical protein